MIKKIESCIYCHEPMESKTAKKKFCSEKCRVYYHRELARGTLDLPKDYLQFKNVGILKQDGEIELLDLSKVNYQTNPYPLPINPESKLGKAILKEREGTSQLKSDVEYLKTTPESYDGAIKKRVAPILKQEVKLPESKSEPTQKEEKKSNFVEEIEKQIAAIEAEKIPKERDTLLGRQVWSRQQIAKIQTLKNKL